jgi:hypothetical protein
MSRIPEPLAGFEHRLLEALTEVDAQRLAATPVARARSPRPVAAGVRWLRPALAAASVVAIVAVAGFAALDYRSGAPNAGNSNGPGPGIQVAPAAFTVQVNNDGSVSFTARDLVDPTAATKALNDAGIAGRVVNNTNGCPDIKEGDLAPGFDGGPHPRPSTGYTGPPPGFVTGDRTVTIRSSDYPSGGGVLVVVQLRQRPSGPWATVLWWAYADVHKIPTCVDITDPGTD